MIFVIVRCWKTGLWEKWMMFFQCAGGFVPADRRGKKFEGIINVADWYGTLTELAGVDMKDLRKVGEIGGLAKDSRNLSGWECWYLFYRKQINIGDSTATNHTYFEVVFFPVPKTLKYHKIPKQHLKRPFGTLAFHRPLRQDTKAEAANAWLKQKGLPLLHEVDSVPQWQNIINDKNGRPDAMHLSSKAVLMWPYKLVTGKQPLSAWVGPNYPNCSTVKSIDEHNGPLPAPDDVTWRLLSEPSF